MQPVAVAVGAVLYVVLVNRDVVALGELVGFDPGGYLELEQFDVSGVVGMHELRMAELMQQSPDAPLVLQGNRGVGDMPVSGVPRKPA